MTYWTQSFVCCNVYVYRGLIFLFFLFNFQVGVWAWKDSFVTLQECWAAYPPKPWHCSCWRCWSTHLHLVASPDATRWRCVDQHLHLVASPDVMIKCHRWGQGILEIKCPCCRKDQAFLHNRKTILLTEKHWHACSWSRCRHWFTLQEVSFVILLYGHQNKCLCKWSALTAEFFSEASKRATDFFVKCAWTVF